jgi:hypothetical protein
MSSKLLVGTSCSDQTQNERAGNPNNMISYMLERVNAGPDFARGESHRHFAIGAVQRSIYHPIAVLALQPTFGYEPKVVSLFHDVPGCIDGSPPEKSLLKSFTRLSLQMDKVTPTTTTPAPSVTPAAAPSTRSHNHLKGFFGTSEEPTWLPAGQVKKQSTGFTHSKLGQREDSEMNSNASYFIGRKCEMTLFDPANLPESILQDVIRPLVSRTNVTDSKVYEADLDIYFDCWIRSQTPDFQSFIKAPKDARAPNHSLIKTRAFALLFDLFGDPSQSLLEEDSEMGTRRNVGRSLFDMHLNRPMLVKCMFNTRSHS